MTPSIPAPTAAGALDLRSALTQIDTIAVCVGAVDPHNFRTMLATIAGIARAALRNSAPKETRGDEPVGLSQLISSKMKEPAFVEFAKAWPLREARYLPIIKMSPCAVSDWYVVLPSGKEIILSNEDWEASAALQQSPRLEREGIDDALPPVARIEMVSFAKGYEEPADPMFCVMVSGICADFKTETAANNMRNAILALLSPDTTVVSSTLHREVGS